MIIVKRWQFKMLVILSVMCVITGCGYKPSTNSFDILKQEDKAVNIIKDEEEAIKLVEENMDAAEVSANEANNAIKEKVDNDFKELDKLTSPAESSGKSLPEIFLLGFYRFYTQLRLSAPTICIISFLIGMCLFHFAKGNKRLRRWGLLGLAIGLPLCVIIVVYGIGFLNGIFLN